MSKFKIITIVLFLLLVVSCLGVDAWYLYIRMYGPDKIVSNTVNVGEMTTADGSVTKYLAEIDYNRNDKKNGLEKLDIKLNYFMDEEKDNFYSQGVQFVGNSKDDKIVFNYLVDADAVGEKSKDHHKNGWYNIEDYYNFWGTYRTNEDYISTYNYMSGDDYTTTANSTNPISLQSSFKLELGEDMFLMKFKGLDTPRTDSNFQYKQKGKYNFYAVFGVQDYNMYYAYYDFNYFAYVLYNSIQSLPAGTNKTFVFEFGDLFNYYRFNGQAYENIALSGNDEEIVKQETKSYYAIKINIKSDGAKKASDSIFNCIHGSQNFNMNPELGDDGYFIGRSVKDVTLKDFNLVKVHENNYALKLKEGFVKEYLPYKNAIVLNVLIDIDALKSLGYEYFGFSNDSGLKDFKIYQCYTQETIDGQLVKSEVQV